MSELKIGAINKITNQYVHPLEAEKDDHFMCIDCNQDVIVKKGNIRKHHFAHKNDSNCHIYENPSESQIHKMAKIILKKSIEQKIPIKIYRKCVRCVNIDESMIDFEKSEFTVLSRVVIEHRFEHNNSTKIADVAYLENECIKYIFEIKNTHKTDEKDRPEPWYEIDAKSIINGNNNKDSKMNQCHIMNIECIRHQLCKYCIINNNVDNKSENGIIYFNQRGAGCGKTFESIQIIQNDDRFEHKDTFIYLTKMHSAKEVIHVELREQEKRGLLSDLEIKDNEYSNENEKQYKVSFFHKKRNKNIEVIIGTIDSFNYAVVDKSKIEKGHDYFYSIVKTIRNGDNKKNIKYANRYLSLSKKYLIVIDEAQDLGKEYIEAFDNIIKNTNIDVYVIGDKLQSIWSEHNIHTYIDTNDLNTRIIRSENVNKVMRFHNRQLMDFVNDIVPFEKFNLPKITSICDNPECRYQHQNEIKPYHIFETPKVYANDYDYNKIMSLIEKVISYMDKEIKENGYLPNNFMFIFPILKSNSFAQRLYERIQHFWSGKFRDEKYQENVLKKNDYWKDKYDKNDVNMYVYLHRSDDRGPINLKESENATRILSIHSSKGNGCEVVFLFGVSESSLKIFSKKSCNLVYESLLHVAITRQKKSIYIGIENNGDDIYKRFRKFDIEENHEIKPEIKIKNYIDIQNIQTSINDGENQDDFDEFNQKIIEPNDYERLIPNDKSSDRGSIIDWGHHQFRNSVMHYELMSNLIKNEQIENENTKDQFLTILSKISKKNIEQMDFKKYMECLKKIYDDKKNHQTDSSVIPIMKFDPNDNTNTIYSHYTNILENIIKNIQNKIKKHKHKIPPLCPLECVILWCYIMDILDNGLYASKCSIMDIYSIMYCYDSCSNEIDSSHTEKNECICSKSFTNQNNNLCYPEIRKSIKKHYDIINCVRNMYIKYKNILSTNITYNINHDIFYGKKGSFLIGGKYDIIGYNSEYVVRFIIKPQFNKLNFYDVIFDSIFNTFMIKNCDKRTENYNRYYGKKILTCIFTLDSETPILYEVNINDIIIKRFIKKYLYKNFKEYHEQIYRFYIYCRKNKPQNISSIKYTYEEIKKEKDKNIKLDYIENFFYDIDKKIVSCKNNKSQIDHIMERVNDKNEFIRELDDYLDKFIDEFLELNIIDNDIIDY
jgi:hypothetical protein